MCTNATIICVTLTKQQVFCSLLQAFPHPLANVDYTKQDKERSMVNEMSYHLVESLTWQGLSDLFNVWFMLSIYYNKVYVYI